MNSMNFYTGIYSLESMKRIDNNRERRLNIGQANPTEHETFKECIHVD